MTTDNNGGTKAERQDRQGRKTRHVKTYDEGDDTLEVERARITMGEQKQNGKTDKEGRRDTKTDKAMATTT